MRKLVNNVKFNASADAVFSPPPLLEKEWKYDRIRNNDGNDFSEWMVVKNKLHKGGAVTKFSEGRMGKLSTGDFKKIQAGFKKLIK